MRRKKKNNLVMLLLILLVSIGIGYALLSQELTINGTGKVSGNNWSIYFEDLTMNPNNVALSQGDVAATINQTTNTDINFTVTLQKPGDFYEFEVAATNGGSIDAMLELVTNNFGGNPISVTNPLPTFLNYTVTYGDGVMIAPNHLLEAGYSETFKVRLEYRTDINPSDLPGTSQSLSFSFGLQYVQADSNAFSRPLSSP